MLLKGGEITNLGTYSELQRRVDFHGFVHEEGSNEEASVLRGKAHSRGEEGEEDDIKEAPTINSLERASGSGAVGEEESEQGEGEKAGGKLYNSYQWKPLLYKCKGF